MTMKKWGSMLLAGALVIGVAFSTSAATKAPVKKNVEYVALGDSLAAGQTPDGYIDYGYPDYIADTFKKSKQYKLIDYENDAIPGYTSIQLKNDLLNSSKIKKQVKEATHITIDIGANDLLAILKENQDLSQQKVQDQLTAAISAVGENLQAILSKIDQLNPKAKVYVMGYYNPFPYYPDKQQALLLPKLTSFNEQISSVAKKNGDKYVSVFKVINDKYLPNPFDIHLNKTGYKVVANEFWKVISK